MSLTPAVTGTTPIRFGIVIVSEDTNSNFFYLEDKIKDCMPNAVDHAVYASTSGHQALAHNSSNVGHTDPFNISKYAINLVKQKNIDYNNGDADEDPHFYKEVYCIVDVDDNGPKPKGNGSLSLAYNEIAHANTLEPEISHNLIVSNECFEIWYILHFHDILIPLYRGTKPQKSHGLINETTKIATVLKNCINTPSTATLEKLTNKNYKRYSHFFKKMSVFGNEEAAIQRAKTLINKSTNRKPCDNPSTELHILIEKLNSFKN